MSKTKVNKQPSIKKGSVVKYSEGGGKGGFRPDPNTTVLGTMNGIMKEQYEGK